MLLRLLKWLILFFEKPPVPEKPNVVEAPAPPPPTPPPVTVIEDVLSIFKAEDMEIYTYHNGEKVVKCDPMALFKKMSEKFNEIQADLRLAMGPIPEGPKWAEKADEAYYKALEKIRWIFDLKPYDQGGLTEKHVLGLYHHFMDYIVALKKKWNDTPTPSATSESASPTLPASP